MRALALGRRNRGVVLSEVIMTTFITGLMFTVLPGFYFTYVRLWSREGSRVDTLERAAIVVQRMEKEVRNARRLSVSSDGKALTIVLPKQRLDSTIGRYVNEIDGQGQLVDGDQVRYYFTADPHNVALGGGIYRRVERVNGTSVAPRLITDQIHPELNPLVSGDSTAQPIFFYDSALRTVAVTVTAVETRASVGDFAPGQTGPRCSRDGGSLARTATQGHPEGELACSVCGSQVKPNAELAVHQIQLLARNQ